MCTFSCLGGLFFVEILYKVLGKGTQCLARMEPGQEVEILGPLGNCFTVPDDLEQVVDIEQRSIQPPWTRAAFAAELDKPSSRFWVLTDDETDKLVVAYAVFSFPAEQVWPQLTLELKI